MVFATSELLIGEEEITDMDGIGLAVIQRPKVTLRRPFTAAREGLSVVGTDGATLLRLERPDGPTIKSLWVENGAGERVGVFTGRSRFALTGGRFEISRDGAVIGTARCGALLDELEAATKDGERVATADRQGEGVVRPAEPRHHRRLDQAGRGLRDRHRDRALPTAGMVRHRRFQGRRLRHSLSRCR
ncbi:hypothetical protein Tcur_4869 [Thermomonospora curvata DSM 43183]|uniref:Uncharacterized protein n=1 Tax=Thermomonospora curvata (strain ATCC 19995 / DSM 43183 / JCM 3096 / KCTC 9072 / NBRC 15933 / NCIMB 10081 / Henssen B9) TaxID=471852 RepID=D1A872_THECD|nr:hypothetical protein Tcur_4869 [Thermomonospora curvata DSM 43183]